MRIDYYLMMLSYLGTLERIMKYLERGVEVEKASKDVQVKREARSNSNLSLPRPPGLACSKTDDKGHTNSIFNGPPMHEKLIS